MSLFPVYQPINGQVDANGNCTINLYALHSEYWALINVTAEQDININGVLTPIGTPNWSLQIDNIKVAYGLDATTEMGPRLAPPKSNVSIVITNGTPNSTISGLVHGIYSDKSDATELMQHWQSGINVLSTKQVPFVRPLTAMPGDSGVYTQQPNVVTTNKVFPIPPGTQSTLFAINDVTPGNSAKWTQTIIGNITTHSYFASGNPGGAGGFAQTFKIIPQDSALLLTLDTTGSANPVTYLFVAYSGFGFVETQLSTGTTSDNSALVVRIVNPPAPWQAGTHRFTLNSLSVASGAAVTIVTGVANQSIYPNAFQLSEAGGNSATGGRWSLQDSNGTIIYDALTSGNRGPIGNGTFEGIPLPSGLSLQIRNGGGNTELVSGFVDYQIF